MKKGNIFIFAIGVITTILWFIPIIGNLPPSMFAYVRLTGALSLAGFTCTFLISTRCRMLDSLFDGLDKAYIIHKWTGIFAVVFAIVHLAVLIMARISVQADVLIKWDIFAMPSILLFVLLIIVAIVGSKMKYETWKVVHKFMIIPYALGVYHYYDASRSPFAFNAFNNWMHIINLIGILSAIYVVFFYEKTAFSFKYKVSDVKFIAEKTFEVTGKPVNKHISYKPGQFAFMKILSGDSKINSRPFTISSAPQNEMIQFTIKSLGDHTAKLMKTIKAGDEFVLSGPHGKFDYTTGGKNQLWIAGGVGIAPFRSFYQAVIPDHISIDLFYAYNGAEGAYLDELKSLNIPNLRVHLIDSDIEGFLTVDIIKRHINITEPVDVYICGPVPMRGNMQNGFKDSGIKLSGFHYEEFTFGR